MKLSIAPTSAPLRKTPLLVLLCAERGRPELPDGVRVPPQALSDFKGENRELRLCDTLAGPAQRVLLVGLGKGAEIDSERLRRAAAQAARKVESLKLASAVLLFPRSFERSAIDERRSGQALAEGAMLGCYTFQEMKSKPAGRHLKAIELRGGGSRFARGAEKGRILAEANAYARDLQNRPANHLRPRDLGAEAQRLARRARRMRCRVWGEPAMERMGLGALLSVSKGSAEPARLIHLIYRPRGRSKGSVAVVGKGLTFDAGGISLKPAAKMDEMKFDMSGAAAVLGLFRALAELDVPWEVHGVIAASENLPDGKANKPGDVVTAMNGTTIEILNTDAEGRLVLADALCYVNRHVEPDTIIDLATLTGAVVTALGHELSGLFASTDGLRDRLLAAGEATGERLWPLPLMDHQKEQMKGQVADLRNINDPSQGGGASAGAAFLSYFAGETEWAHLDIAGTAWGTLQRDWVGGSGGTGVGVRLLYNYLENLT